MDLTEKLLQTTPAAPDPEQIEAEIVLLDAMIGDLEPKSGARFDELTTQLRTLMWARDPDGFGPPSTDN